MCVDNAAWLLYAAENNLHQFDEMIPVAYQPGLSYRHTKVGSMPSFSVGTDPQKIKAAADQGYFIMKLKTGSSGTQKEMIEKDIAFLSAVHKAIGHYETPIPGMEKYLIILMPMNGMTKRIRFPDFWIMLGKLGHLIK